MGALVAARLVHYPQAALDLQVHSTTYSSDSEVALAWVRSAANSGKPFGRNRVEEIQQLVEPASWRHCPGKNNPADWLSRGVAVTKLVAGSQWWHGPRWLAGRPQTWPRKQEDPEHSPLIPPEEERTSGRSPLPAIHEELPLPGKRTAGRQGTTGRRRDVDATDARRRIPSGD
ncbi:hypothetical protein T12_4580 [Trichinella patagoniensis]|uniref:Uncharacterized protein n=1 Tax=Trichinella patagoniensis TaxID=990121 RepID=A0A0V0ZCB0_9BILA|nr:hypothetical protein T12_4580 [Trichinella patagoniensis]